MIEKAIQILHKLLERLKTGTLIKAWLHIDSLYIVSEIFKTTFYRCLDSWKADFLSTQQWQVAAGLHQGVCFLLCKMDRNKLLESLKEVMHVEIFEELGLVTSNTSAHCGHCYCGLLCSSPLCHLLLSVKVVSAWTLLFDAAHITGSQTLHHQRALILSSTLNEFALLSN